jgi:hypothetical protein
MWEPEYSIVKFLKARQKKTYLGCRPLVVWVVNKLVGLGVKFKLNFGVSKKRSTKSRGVSDLTMYVLSYY